MFRRREDELNDADATGQGSLLGGGSESVKVLNQEASAYSASTASTHSPASPSTPSYAGSMPARTPSPDAPAPRAGSSSSAAGGFRSGQPQGEITRQRTSEKASGGFSSQAAQGTARADSRRVLTVGSDILLKGEIATCDRLVIEGKVDAVLNDVGTVELAESGSFKGVATVENAEISGLFEGELVVKGRLVIYASGRVRGKITYGEIEIERGGELTGEIKTMASANAARTSNRSMKDDKEKVAAA